MKVVEMPYIMPDEPVRLPGTDEVIDRVLDLRLERDKRTRGKQAFYRWQLMTNGLVWRTEDGDWVFVKGGMGSDEQIVRRATPLEVETTVKLPNRWEKVARVDTAAEPTRRPGERIRVRKKRPKKRSLLRRAFGEQSPLFGIDMTEQFGEYAWDEVEDALTQYGLDTGKVFGALKRSIHPMPFDPEEDFTELEVRGAVVHAGYTRGDAMDVARRLRTTRTSVLTGVAEAVEKREDGFWVVHKGEEFGPYQDAASAHMEDMFQVNDGSPPAPGEKVAMLHMPGTLGEAEEDDVREALEPVLDRANRRIVSLEPSMGGFTALLDNGASLEVSPGAGQGVLGDWVISVKGEQFDPMSPKGVEELVRRVESPPVGEDTEQGHQVGDPVEVSTSGLRRMTLLTDEPIRGEIVKVISTPLGKNYRVHLESPLKTRTGRVVNAVDLRGEDLSPSSFEEDVYTSDVAITDVIPITKGGKKVVRLPGLKVAKRRRMKRKYQRVGESMSRGEPVVSLVLRPREVGVLDDKPVWSALHESGVIEVKPFKMGEEEFVEIRIDTQRKEWSDANVTALLDEVGAVNPALQSKIQEQADPSEVAGDINNWVQTAVFDYAEAEWRAPSPKTVKLIREVKLRGMMPTKEWLAERLFEDPEVVHEIIMLRDPSDEVMRELTKAPTDVVSKAAKLHFEGGFNEVYDVEAAFSILQGKIEKGDSIDAARMLKQDWGLDIKKAHSVIMAVKGGADLKGALKRAGVELEEQETTDPAANLSMQGVPIGTTAMSTMEQDPEGVTSSSTWEPGAMFKLHVLSPETGKGDWVFREVVGHEGEGEKSMLVYKTPEGRVMRLAHEQIDAALGFGGASGPEELGVKLGTEPGEEEPVPPMGEGKGPRQSPKERRRRRAQQPSEKKPEGLRTALDRLIRYGRPGTWDVYIGGEHIGQVTASSRQEARDAAAGKWGSKRGEIEVNRRAVGYGEPVEEQQQETPEIRGLERDPNFARALAKYHRTKDDVDWQEVRKEAQRVLGVPGPEVDRVVGQYAVKEQYTLRTAAGQVELVPTDDLLFDVGDRLIPELMDKLADYDVRVRWKGYAEDARIVVSGNWPRGKGEEIVQTAVKGILANLGFESVGEDVIVKPANEAQAVPSTRVIVNVYPAEGESLEEIDAALKGEFETRVWAHFVEVDPAETDESRAKQTVEKALQAGGISLERAGRRFETEERVMDEAKDGFKGKKKTVAGREVEEPTHLKSLAKKAGVSLDKALTAWGEAQRDFEKAHPDVKKGSDRYYTGVTGFMKARLGLKTKPAKKESVTEAFDVGGWSVEDESFTTRGADPTRVQKYVLTKDGVEVEIEEFQGIVRVTDQSGEQQFSLLSKEAAQKLDSYLQSIGAPTLDEIEVVKDEQREEDPFGGRDPYYGHEAVEKFTRDPEFNDLLNKFELTKNEGYLIRATDRAARVVGIPLKEARGLVEKLLEIVKESLEVSK